jgi:hypothetical protein
MAEPMNIGLDFGSLGWRAAYVTGEEITLISANAGWENPARWLLCNASPTLALGVHFPSIKSRLGMEATEPPESMMKSATATVQELLGELCCLVGERTEQPLGQLVIAVPALYSAARRAALRDVALTAGFTDVHLLNDAMAAVIGLTHQRQESMTVLVYSAGYSGFEVGLLRVAKGRYRAIAYDGASVPSGAAFDTLIMRSCLQALTTQRLWSPTHTVAPDTWLRLRDAVQRLKELLTTEASVELALDVITSGAKHTVRLSLSQEDFERAVTGVVTHSLDIAERLLDDANLSSTDIDEILLIGGSTRIGVMQRLVKERFARQPVISPAQIIAQGAALYAARLGTFPATEAVLMPRADLDAHEEPPPAIPVVKVTFSPVKEEEVSVPRVQQMTQQERVAPTAETPMGLVLDLAVSPSPSATHATSMATTIERPNASTESVSADRTHLFQYAHQLIAQGAYDRAKGFLQGLIQDANALLVKIPSRATPTMRREIEEALRQAHAFLEAGRCREAVVHSHYAYSLDPENPVVFEQMIDIHCQAAMAHTSIEGHVQSMEWLHCALGHDRTNINIHDRIAARQFLHAQQTLAQGNHAEALKALEECLYFNPLHAEAQRLRDTLAPAVSP